MLRFAIAFFVMGLLTFIMGSYGLMHVSSEAGKLFLVAFFSCSFLSLLGGMVTETTRS